MTPGTARRPRDVAEAARITKANKIAKGKAISESGKYRHLVTTDGGNHIPKLSNLRIQLGKLFPAPNGRSKVPEFKFHSLRQTYASLCVAAGIEPAKLSGRMGHANVRTTLDVYVHLFPDDDATEDMAALGAMAALKPAYSDNVIGLRG